MLRKIAASDINLLQMQIMKGDPTLTFLRDSLCAAARTQRHHRHPPHATPPHATPTTSLDHQPRLSVGPRRRVLTLTLTLTVTRTRTRTRTLTLTLTL